MNSWDCLLFVVFLVLLTSSSLLRNSLLLLSLLTLPNFVRMSGCEGGDEGRHGSVWDRVSLCRGFSVGGSPIEFRNEHVFQYIRVFVEYLHG